MDKRKWEDKLIDTIDENKFNGDKYLIKHITTRSTMIKHSGKFCRENRIINKFEGNF